MKYCVLEYEVVKDNYVERRAPFRELHLRLIRDSQGRGEIVMAGALGDPPDGALLVFKAPASVAEDFARNDPYVVNGLVTNWVVRPWNVVTEPAT
jgi:uncharacterized protein YciI